MPSFGKRVIEVGLVIDSCDELVTEGGDFAI